METFKKFIWKMEESKREMSEYKGEMEEILNDSDETAKKLLDETMEKFGRKRRK